MQAYANVATAPVRKVSQQTSKTYWEFRAAESSKGDDKNPTWYTVRIFKEEDPKLEKGDFVVFTGKLKNDVFMSREGKPMGVLTVMAFQLVKVSKDGKRRDVISDSPAKAGRTDRESAAPVSEAHVAANNAVVRVEANVQSTVSNSKDSTEPDYLWLMSR